MAAFLMTFMSFAALTVGGFNAVPADDAGTAGGDAPALYGPDGCFGQCE